MARTRRRRKSTFGQRWLNIAAVAATVWGLFAAIGITADELARLLHH